MDKPKVLVVGGDVAVESLFTRRGFGYIRLAEQGRVEPDLVVFTGGADVNPELYGERKIKGVHIDPKRDARERQVFNRYQEIPKVGICRGGQFLNVLSGGAMWQHVDNHTNDHEMIDLLLGKKKVKTTSTHHQMMIAAPDGDVIAVCDPPRTTITLTDNEKRKRKPEYDTEVVWYERTNSLCFQGHPEYSRQPECTEYFFDLIKYFWGLGD